MDKAHSPGSPARSSPVRAVGRETPLFSINQNTHNGSASVGGGGTGGGGGGAGGAAQAVLEHHPISFILAEKEKQLKTLYQSLEQRLSEREAEVV